MLARTLQTDDSVIELSEFGDDGVLNTLFYERHGIPPVLIRSA